jgi:DNA-binding LacI/PurR family transcriptional regulator
LALNDLENRGLIYRKHGKGTFAHGTSTKTHRCIGVLIKSTQVAEHRPIAEMVRGVQTVAASLQSAILLISMAPEAWRPELASTLGGVIVVPHEVTTDDLDILKNRNLPFIIFGESPLPGPHMLLGQKEAARTLTEQLLAKGHRRIALLTGYDSCLDAPKRIGVHEALRAAGIDPAHVAEFSAHDREDGVFKAADEVLKASPRPTGVVAFDDSLGTMLRLHARREQIPIPGALSIVSFHDWPYLNSVEPALTTVHFEFFEAGVRAAKALNRAAQTGEALTDVHFEPCYRVGQTVGPAAA